LQSDYSKNGSYIQLALPIHTEVLIPVDDSVRLIDQVLEEIDYRELYLTYSSEGRNPAVEPKTLFKIMVYAYSQHIYSSREIEKACKLNLAFMYLLKGEKAPDHNTIARFRREHLISCVEGLLTQLVKLLAEADEIHFENLFMRGAENVRTEYLVLAIAFDLNKLHYRIQNNRLGQSLFPLPESA
ncbi:MAG: transposase, partial [Saccharofermentans sp.]|nr:transposase [Saccharofermentans sp.]